MVCESISNNPRDQAPHKEPECPHFPVEGTPSGHLAESALMSGIRGKRHHLHLFFEQVPPPPAAAAAKALQSCPTLCNPMNRSTPGLPVHHQLWAFTQTHRCARPSGVPRGPATSTGSLASQRHPGKFPKVPGRRRGQKQYPAMDVTSDRSKV